MSLTVLLSTGDATAASKAIRSLEITVDRPLVAVRMAMSGTSGTVPAQDWPRLIEQVRDNELVRRHSKEGLPPPLSGYSAVAREIQSTPTFQLFLAGIDVAERIDLVSESPPQSVLRRFRLLDRWVPSVTGRGGLVFVPEKMFAEIATSVVRELLLNNKLGSVELEGITRHYLPYATPIGFIIPVSREAEDLWDAIRAFHNDLRHSA